MKRIALAASILAASSNAARADGPPRLPQTPPGWKIETVAQAPEIAHPSVVCSIPDGRLLVAEDPMSISAPADIPSDRILCLHPDGRLTVFAEKLYSVFGMRYLEGKVYVLHNPKFSVFTDDGGVGRDRADLIESTNPNPWALDWNDHIPANFRLGMDGYFYIAVGDKGVYGAVGRDGKRVDMKGGGILRVRPDATGLEVYSTGTRNHPDVAMNAEDELFTYDNTDEKNAWWTRVTHMVDGGYYGFPWDYRPRRPYTLWMMTDYGGGAPAGAVAYEEDALPAEYRGNLFLVEWARRELLRLRVERDGASYRIVSSENFLPAAPGDFKPVGIDVSADGLSFWIADWNHPDTKANVRVGRLHKLSWTGKSEAAPRPGWYVPAAMGRPFEAATAELAAALSHPARSVRLTAQRRLSDRGPAAVEPLRKALADGSVPPRARWHALWALDAIDGGAAARAEIIAALRDREPSVALQAARQLGTRRVKEAVPSLVELLRSKDAALRFRAATALGRIGDAVAIPALIEALGDGDLFARHAVFRALNRLGRADAGAWPRIAAGLSSPNAAAREGTIFALRDTHDPGAVKALAGALARPGVPGETRAAALREIAAVHRKEPEWKGEWWAYFPLSSGPPKKTLEWAGTPIARAALLAGLEDPDPAARRAAAEGLRDAADLSAGEAVAAAFASERDPEARAALLAALSALGRPEAARAAEEIAADTGAHPALVLEAVRDASRRKDARALAALAAPARAPEVLVAALESIEALGAPAALGEVAALLGHGNEAVRSAAVEALASLGGEAAAARAAAMLSDTSVEIRRSAIRALGKLGHRESIPALRAAFINEETRFEAALALARMPDPGAVDAYLFGIESRNAELRQSACDAVRAIVAEALPAIEAKVAAGAVGPRGAAELQRILSEGEPLREWTVIGPLAFDAPPPDSDPASSSWKSVAARADGLVDLRDVFGGKDGRASAYARAVFHSPEAREAQLLTGSDDTIIVRVNGEAVHERSGIRRWSPADDKFTARLRAGENTVLVRCGNEGGEWGFSLRIAPPRRGPIFEARAESPSPEEYLEHAVASSGDPARGKRLFEDRKGVACVRCHGSGPGGREELLGPDLSGIGAQYDRRQLAEHVLWPSKAVREGYRQTTAILKDGQVVSGLARGESAGEVIILDADGKEHRLREEEIGSRENTDLSIMPEGLQATLSLEDFSDIISFLESSRSSRTVPRDG